MRIAEQLHFDGRWKILIQLHLLRRFAVNHHAAVPERPARSARHLIAHKTVFDAQDVIRQRILPEQVPEASAEVGIARIGDFQDAVLDAEGIGMVRPSGMAGDLGRPAIEVFAVEELNPLGLDIRGMGGVEAALRDSAG